MALKHSPLRLITGMRFAIVTLAVFISVLVSGCGDKPVPAEQQIRHLFDRVEQAAEGRSLADLMEFVSDDYHDSRGRSWEDVRKLVQLEFIRNPKIHTFKVVRDLKLQSDKAATATLLVALAGRPIDSASTLTGLRADLMRFDLTLINENGWKVQTADWQWAEVTDFL